MAKVNPAAPVEGTIDIPMVIANNGVFIKLQNASIRVNGEEPQPSYRSGWYLVGDVPKVITKKVSQPNTNYRYELIDPINFPTLPPVMPREEVYESNGGYCEWKAELKHLEGLYTLKYDPQPPKEVEVPFNLIEIMKVDRNIGELNFQYPRGGGAPLVLSEVKNYTVDEMFYPEIVREYLPCKLTSRQTFDIIATHVKANINPKVAQVTSDYKFHFKVIKHIALHEPAKKTREVLTPTGRSYKNKKYRTYTVVKRDYTVFEMYHDWRQYGPDITPFSANSAEELKVKIDTYLEDLMEAINTPLQDCPHCKGMGVVISE